jgi:hypothetical protein
VHKKVDAISRINIIPAATSANPAAESTSQALT